MDGGRTWMDKRKKETNDYRRRVSPIRGAQALDFFTREL